MGVSRIPGDIRIDIGPRRRKPSPFPPRPALAAWEHLLKLVPNYRQAPVIRAEIKRMRAQLEKQEKK
jgi:hypothetical protein